MRKTQKIRLFGLITGVLVSSFALIGENIVQAQRPPRPVELLRSRCVSSGLGSAREDNTDISIGRAVYTSRFFLGAGSRSASLTCRIKPDSRKQAIFQTLNLGFGMRDNDSRSPSAEVRVYLDGRPAEARTVSTSMQNTLSLDVSNVSNVSIEAVCTSGRYCDRVYFYEASLLRPGTQTNVAPSSQPTQQFSVPGAPLPVPPPPTTAPAPITPQKY